ncbi:MAG: FAD-dependent oxidoreductase [Chloroflexota bacterium]
MKAGTAQPKVLILGGGVAGLQTALALNDMGIESLLVEKEQGLGGRVKNYDRIFPFFHSGRDLVSDLEDRVRRSHLAEIRCGTTVSKVEGRAPHFDIALTGSSDSISAAAVVIATGFEPFDASLQEEYGYGIYGNVITGTELEGLLDPEGPTKGEVRRPSDGKIVSRVAIVFCVGSRNEKLGHNYCSRICCSYSTKQAIEIKERHPAASVTCFYIDVRTYGRGFEEMYRRAQEMGVTYIRGRVAECAMLPNGDIAIKAEDTFLGRPVQGVFDLVSLSHGMTPSLDAPGIAAMLGLEVAEDGFFECRDRDLYPNDSTAGGVFLVGAALGMKPIPDCIADGNAVAARVAAFLARAQERD